MIINYHSRSLVIETVDIELPNALIRKESEYEMMLDDRADRDARDHQDDQDGRLYRVD